MKVVALSGGKDSTALALRLAEVEDGPWVYVCTPTGDELPMLWAHWEALEGRLSQSIIRLGREGGLARCLKDNNALPNWRMRFCTRQLKLEPMQAWISEQAEPVVLHVGLRADEEGREGGIYRDAEVRFPFREWGWGLEEVLGYLAARQVAIPERTDCARCFFQRLADWWQLWKDYPEIYQDAVLDELRYGATYRSPQRDTWPTSLQDLRAEFERGRLPPGVNAQRDLFGFEANQCRVCSL